MVVQVISRPLFLCISFPYHLFEKQKNALSFFICIGEALPAYNKRIPVLLCGKSMEKGNCDILKRMKKGYG